MPRDEAAARPPLSGEERSRLARQRRVARLLSPLWVPAATAVMSLGMGWRIENSRELREGYQLCSL